MSARRRRRRAGSSLFVLCLVSFAEPGGSRADEVATAVYVRSDTDRTLVVAPRLRASKQVGESTRVGAVYAVDVWTSASIDIMTSASQVPVTEQRDELDLSIDHELQDATFTAAYRYSIEPDYVSHGGSGGLSYDFADNNTTIALGLSGSSDTVGRAGDPLFSRPAGTFAARLSFTQLLGADTLLQWMYEPARATGYQASPYRFVAIGGDGLCTSGATGAGGFAPLCVPETNPGKRMRHATAIELRHALGERWSLGGAYRLYVDDWGIVSHTARAEVAWSPGIQSIVTARYRFYTQGAADHYLARYVVPQPLVTSDKELSPLSSHRIAFEVDRLWRLAGDRTLSTTLSFAPILFSYRDFVPLDQIVAYEVNAAVVLVL